MDYDQERRERKSKQAKFFVKLTGIGVLGFIGFIYWMSGFTEVEPGEYAIVIQQFGEEKGVQDDGLDVGTHWVEPFYYDVENYDTRAQQYPMEVHASTKDGQPVQVAVTFEISLQADMVKTLHSSIGRDYYNRVVEPAARAALRDALPTQLSDTVYTDAGRSLIQSSIAQSLIDSRIAERGILVSVNLQEVKFLNDAFVNTLEEKARAAQQATIQERLAEAAEQEAIKVANAAEGEKQKRIKAAEAQREEMRLTGEGSRLQKEEEAAGLLAMVTAEAEGVRLRREALSGRGGAEMVSIAWAENMGPNVKIYAVPTGAPGTTSIFDMNGVIQGALAGSQ
jgi:regulator of protease activity HflC (stomatin/prohibitin superfamily)